MRLLLPLLLLAACSSSEPGGPGVGGPPAGAAGSAQAPPAVGSSASGGAAPGAPSPRGPGAAVAATNGPDAAWASPGSAAEPPAAAGRSSASDGAPGGATSISAPATAPALVAALATANAATTSGAGIPTAEGQTARRPGHASVPTLPLPGTGRHLAAAAGGQPLNAIVLKTLGGYPLGEANPYDWHRGVNTDGVSRDLFWRGVPLAAAGGDGGVHCSGITWEVYLRSLTEAVGEGAGPTGEELLAAKDTWYVRTEDEAGPVGALVGRGLGVIPADVAALQPGDFIQFWRNNGKGHSAIFLSHRYNPDGTIRGLVYWSAQGSSGGIGRRIISFGEDVNQVNRLYAVRATHP